MTITLNDTWKCLNNYFDIKAHCEKIAEERDNFDCDWAHHKIVYSGQNIKLAKMLVNKKFLVIENRGGK
jgi:hypothetical protein